MVKEEDERQFAVKKQEEEATADANAELKAEGDEMYVEDNVVGNPGKRGGEVKEGQQLLIVDIIVESLINKIALRILFDRSRPPVIVM